MPMSDSVLTFIIVSFVLALILILKKDSLPAKIKRFLAIITLVLIVISFILVLISFFNLGQSS
ncbi:hypothetical protein E0485_19970 [Paenibacillus albiflavus]|uniref:Uncharacterized protein n=1 Tax=Paenibacillus albiflavus TaxID=2545760 RepID=A0A4R4E840_9BACL|nr:hypothetical protein [Paenibacillus albiflavus]TCZ74261.1 hypothetical protein E0485_19970 [Paenibacillus albiflavus]